MIHLEYPYRIAANGRTSLADDDTHVRNLIEQVLFTSPGERVNRPSFGSGLQQLVFAGLQDELVQATQALVQGALQQWLGDLIDVTSVDTAANESSLTVTVQYVVRRSQRPVTAQFRREV